MIDPDRLELTRSLATALIARGDPLALVVEAATNTADQMLARLEATDKEPDGHPAEVALQHLLSLIDSHPDPLLRKWIDANSRVCKMTYLLPYLAAEIE